MKNSSKRSRVFATIIYPESCVENFLDIINDWHVNGFLSPLHDKDVDKDGVIEKAHYHLLVRFEGNKSVEQVKEKFDSIKAVGVEVVDSFRGYARYLCHLDESDPRKTKYDTADVRPFGSVVYDEVISSSIDINNILKDILSFVNCYHVTLFCELVDYASEHEPDWFKVLCSGHTIFITQYLKSCEYGASHKDLYKLIQ